MNNNYRWRIKINKWTNNYKVHGLMDIMEYCMPGPMAYNPNSVIIYSSHSITFSADLLAQVTNK